MEFAVEPAKLQAMQKSISLCLPLLLAACHATVPAIDVPAVIRDAPAQNISTVQALQEPERLRGTFIRWGGEIASVENRRDETWIEVVDQPLGRHGKPEISDRSTGRFLMHVPGFLDPVVYAKGRLITVAGTLDPPVTRKIGDFPYRYSVISAATQQLWPRGAETAPAHAANPVYPSF